jgi:hypothetical protein
MKVTKIITQVMILRLLLMKGQYQNKKVLLLRWLAQASNLQKGEDYILADISANKLSCIDRGHT